MGALRCSIEAIFEAVTGKRLQTAAFGKPQIPTFEFAGRLVEDWRKSLCGIDTPLETVYFIGDTSESDIRGANEYNKYSQTQWYSILVCTGVYHKNTTPSYPPRHIADNVLDAVLHAVERERRNDRRNAF